MKVFRLKRMLVFLFSCSMILTSCSASSSTASTEPEMNAKAQSVSDKIVELDSITDVIEKRDALAEIEEAYEALSDEEQESIPNYLDYKNSKYKFTESLKKEVEENPFAETYKYKMFNGDIDEYIDLYYDYSSDDDKSLMLAYKGMDKVKDYLISEIKEVMKDPSSFKLYSYDVVGPYDDGNGNYSVIVEMDYGGANSFGGMVRDTLKGSVNYTVNTKNKTTHITGGFTY